MSRSLSPDDLLPRLEAGDASLWPEGNVSGQRLGWLHVAEQMAAEADALRSWAETISCPRVVLMGMGGSSLGPEVLRAAAGVDPGAVRDGHDLVVLDTTDPATVASVDLSDAFVLLSSKSGTTLEVKAHFAHAWAAVPDGRRFAAITDPGTPLADLAAERSFDRCFVNRPDIGGRYSVLSYFGMVPAALLGYDVAALCRRALSVDRAEAVELGVAMGQAATQGQDKVTIVVPERFRAFGLWVEQLIAESTGKSGTGCIPVPTVRAEDGPDRFVVPVELDGALDLGAQFFRWELATAVAGAVLGIDPFDEPNVAESKANTNAVLASLPVPEEPAIPADQVLAWLSSTVHPGDYVSVQAYLPYGQDAELEQARRRIGDHLGGAAVTAGYGPRFLHSTGQLHKGGPDTVVAVQLVPRADPPAVPIPGFPYDYGTLIRAQAAGDLRSLRDHGRRAVRVVLDSPSELA